MSRTEQHLWDRMDMCVRRSGYAGQASRFEVTTQTGVSDTEYVLNGWHGWVELKVSATVRPDTPLRFGSHLTAEQCAWLLSHHIPSRYLRSWLLVGLSSARAWRGFLLFPAPKAVRFLRPVQPTLNALRRDGVRLIATMDEVVETIAR